LLLILEFRIVESTLRTANNLLERLHASFFFYLLPAPASFIKIGFYLPSAVIISTSMMFGGLGVWVRAGWRQVATEKPGSMIQWERRTRPAVRAISIMVVTHIAGLCLFFLVSSKTYLENQTVSYASIPSICQN
jgi:glycosylphosphatidylinositol transamidase